MKKIRKILCRIFGHKWPETECINGVWVYKELICERCHKRKRKFNPDDFAHIGWKWYGGYGRSVMPDGLVSDHKVRIEQEA